MIPVTLTDQNGNAHGITGEVGALVSFSDQQVRLRRQMFTLCIYQFTLNQ